MTDSTETKEKEFKVSGSDLLDKIKELFHQGNVRHIIIRNESGKTLIELPLTMGILGVALIPAYAAVAAIAALAVKCSIEVKTTQDQD
jgi:repressor of nif and glnA expression